MFPYKHLLWSFLNLEIVRQLQTSLRVINAGRTTRGHQTAPASGLLSLVQVEASQRATGGPHAARRSGRMSVRLNPLESSQDHVGGRARHRRNARMMARLRVARRRANIRKVSGARGRRLSAQRLSLLRHGQARGYCNFLASPLILEGHAY